MHVGIYLVTLIMLASAHFAQAQESAHSTAKIDEVAPIRNTPKGEDVDEIITNIKMRAETGSKSKYSISTSMNYAAGNLADPFGQSRPNLANATGSTDWASLGGSIGGKYAFTTQHALFAGVGLRWITPFAGTKTPPGYSGSKIDIDNPSYTLQYLYRWSGIQSALSFNETFFTNSNLLNDGYVTTWGLTQNNIYDLGHSGFAVGLSVYVGLGYFNKNTPEARTNQSDYSGGVSPAVEYRVNDRLNLRTDSNLFIYQHVRSERNANTYQRQAVTQSLSIGYAVRRDIYIYPSLTWVPGHLSADRTLLAIGGNINLF